MTQQLYLAANLVTQTAIFGHLQIVYEDTDGNLYENETTSPGFPYFFGNWAFPEFDRQHDTESNTPGYGNPDLYSIVSLDLLPEQTAEHVWELMGQINASLSNGGHSLNYDVDQNSNSYAASVLSVVGIDIADYLDNVTPPEAQSFPGVDTNVFQGAKTGGLFSDDNTRIPLTLSGTAGNDYIVAGIGKDTLGGAAGHDTIYGGDKGDLLEGGSGRDALFGDAGSDTLLGGNGRDVLQGGSGGDSLRGGNGIDWLDYRDSDGGVSIDLLENTASGGHATNDSIAEFERVFGSMGNDALTGDAADNRLVGKSGNDTIDGGDGNDTLKGNSGNDVFVFSSGEDILMGGSGEDIVLFDGDLADFHVTKIGAREWTVSNMSTDDISSLTGVETLVFDDGSLNLLDFLV